MVVLRTHSIYAILIYKLPYLVSCSLRRLAIVCSFWFSALEWCLSRVVIAWYNPTGIVFILPTRFVSLQHFIKGVLDQVPMVRSWIFSALAHLQRLLGCPIFSQQWGYMNGPLVRERANRCSGAVMLSCMASGVRPWKMSNFRPLAFQHRYVDLHSIALLRPSVKVYWYILSWTDKLAVQQHIGRRGI